MWILTAYSDDDITMFELRTKQKQRNHIIV